MAESARGKGYTTGRLRREKIIRVATELFSRVGYRNATILEIAATVGISRAGLLHHFPTKESLLEAVLEERDRVDRDRFRRNGSARADGIGILRGMVDLARHNAQAPHLIALYTVLSAEAHDPDHPAHGYYVHRYERIRSGTRRALELAADADLLAPGIAIDREATALVALMDGLQVQWLLAPEKVDMAGELEAAIDRLLSRPLGATSAPEQTAPTG